MSPTCPAAGSSSAAPRSAPARCSPPAPATTPATTTPRSTDQGRRRATRTPRPARRSSSASPRRPPTTAGSPPSPTTPRRRPRRTPTWSFKPVAAGTDAAAQRAALATLIAQKPDVIVLLPHDGKELNAAGLRGDGGRHPGGQPGPGVPGRAGVPRCRSRATTTAWASPPAPTSAQQLKAKGVASPIIGEIAGIDALELTQERSQGFNDALATLRLQGRQPASPAEFTADSGQEAATDLLQALPKMDALWNHDDDQGIGVLAAINQANRKRVLHGRRRRLEGRHGRHRRPTTACSRRP